MPWDGDSAEPGAGTSGPGPGPAGGSWSAPRDRAVGPSHRFSAGPAGTAGLLRSVAVRAGPVPPCHLHLHSVPPLEAAVERLYRTQWIWELRERRVSQNIPVQQQMSSGAVGTRAVRAPLLGVPKSPGNWGRCPCGRTRSRGMCGPGAAHGEKCGGRWCFAPASCSQLGLQNVGISYLNGGIDSDCRDNCQPFRES